ncbi:hypothetical protein Bca101_008544 [Brassica carinata]
MTMWTMREPISPERKFGIFMFVGREQISNVMTMRASDSAWETRYTTLPPVYTIQPTMFFGFAIDPGARFYQDQDLQKSRFAFSHVLESGNGGAVFGSSESFSCFSTHCSVRTKEYGGVSMWTKSFSKKLRFVIIAGELIGEQVLQLSPFLMNIWKKWLQNGQVLRS